LRQLHLDRLLNDRNGDQEDDEKNEHHVDERSRVDLRHRGAFFEAVHVHRHDRVPPKAARPVLTYFRAAAAAGVAVAGRALPPLSPGAPPTRAPLTRKACRSAAKFRRASWTSLFLRSSQL